MNKEKKISERSVARLSEYRSALGHFLETGTKYIYSHELARICGVTPAQLRRDLMHVGCQGTASKGYSVFELKKELEEFLGFNHERKMALAGVGNLGRALLNYFADRSSRLKLVAAFDVDSNLVDRVIHGVRCYHIGQMADCVSDLGISVGIITVPKADALNVGRTMVNCGISGLINFAPVQMQFSPDIFVENLNLSTVFEKVSFFAKEKSLLNER